MSVNIKINRVKEQYKLAPKSEQEASMPDELTRKSYVDQQDNLKQNTLVDSQSITIDQASQTANLNAGFKTIDYTGNVTIDNNGTHDGVYAFATYGYLESVDDGTNDVYTFKKDVHYAMYSRVNGVNYEIICRVNREGEAWGDFVSFITSTQDPNSWIENTTINIIAGTFTHITDIGFAINNGKYYPTQNAEFIYPMVESHSFITVNNHGTSIDHGYDWSDPTNKLAPMSAVLSLNNNSIAGVTSLIVAQGNNANLQGQKILALENFQTQQESKNTTTDGIIDTNRVNAENADSALDTRLTTAEDDILRALNGLIPEWESVKIATSQNCDLSAACGSYGQVGYIEGTLLGDGDRVLVRAQNDASENGIYVYDVSLDKLTRASDCDSVTEHHLIHGKIVHVDEGIYEGQSAMLLVPEGTTIVIDSSDLTFNMRPTPQARGAIQAKHFTTATLDLLNKTVRQVMFTIDLNNGDTVASNGKIIKNASPFTVNTTDKPIVNMILQMPVAGQTGVYQGAADAGDWHYADGEIHFADLSGELGNTWNVLVSGFIDIT